MVLELPNKKVREEILDHYIGNRKGPDVNLEILGRNTAGLSGADLFNIANWAAIEAVKVSKLIIRLSKWFISYNRKVLQSSRKIYWKRHSKIQC